MKKFLFTIFFLFLIVFGGLTFFIIRSFNSENFQKQIVQSVSELTGREFNIMGATYVSWFPSPKIVLNDVTLSNAKESSRSIMMHANRIGIQLEWQSLLKNPLVINRIDVENPVLFLERINADQVNWNFPFLSVSDSNKLNSDILNSTQNFNQIRINNMRIKGGSIEYSNIFTNTKIPFSNINGNIKLDSLHGPYSFNGTFQAKKNEFSTKIQVKQLHTNTPVPFSLNLTGAKGAFILDMNGNLKTDNKKKMNISANASFTIQRPNDVLQFFHLKPLNETLNIPSLGSMTYESNNGTDNLKSFTIRFGNDENAIALTGSFSQEEKNKKLFYNGSLAINTFDYTQWADLFSDLNWNYLDNQNIPDFDLKLNVQKMLYKNQTIRDASLNISKKSNRLVVQSLKALLPGETLVSAEGSSLTQDGKTGLSLIVSSVSKNLRQFINPFIDMKQVKNGLMKDAKFNGNIIIWPDIIDIDIQSLNIDQALISGKMQIKPFEKTPIINTDLVLNNINLDNYTGYQRPKQPIQLKEALPFIKTYLKNASFLTTFNSSFNIIFTDITFHQLPIRKGDLSGNLTNGLLKLDTLTTQDMATAALTGSGEFAEIGNDNLNIKNLKLDIHAKQLKLFMERANLETQNGFLKKTNEIQTTLQLSEDKNIWTILMQNKIGDLETRVSGKINTQTDIPSYEGIQFTLTYPSFQKFMKTVVGTNSMNTSLDGSLTLHGIINGNAQNFKLTNGDLKIGPQQLTTDGHVEISDTQKAFSLNILTPSFDIEKYILNDFKKLTESESEANHAFNFSILDKWQAKIKINTNQLLYKSLDLKNAVLDLSVQNKVLTLNELSGSQNTTDDLFKASGSLSWTDIPEIRGNIHTTNSILGSNFLSGNKMSFGNGSLTMDTDFSAKGKTPNEMKSSLTGRGTLSIENPIWIGTDLEKVTPLIEQTIKNQDTKTTFDVTLNRLLNSGKTTLESLSGPFAIDKGVIKMVDTSLKTAGLYSNPMQIIYNIPTNTLDISIPISLEAYPDLPPFALTVKGSPNNLVYQPNFVDLSNSVADIVEKRNAKIALEVQKEQIKQEKITLTERQEKVEQAVEQARKAVKSADEKLFAGDNQAAAFLLQNARDALSIVNNLSIKENLTDAEYIQLMEQSRLAILKANEAFNEAVQDKYFEDRKQVSTFAKQSQEMLFEIKQLHKLNPAIEIIHKLIPPVEKYVTILEEESQKVSEDISDEEHFTLMENARDTFKKVVKAYEYVSRFDLDDTGKKIIPISTKTVQKYEPVLPDAMKEPTEKFVAQEDELNPFQTQGVTETEPLNKTENQTKSDINMPNEEANNPTLRGVIKRAR